MLQASSCLRVIWTMPLLTCLKVGQPWIVQALGLDDHCKSLPSEIVYSTIQEISNNFPVDYIYLDCSFLFATSLYCPSDTQLNVSQSGSGWAGTSSWAYDLLLRATIHYHEQQAYSKPHVSGKLFYLIISWAILYQRWKSALSSYVVWAALFQVTCIRYCMM